MNYVHISKAHTVIEDFTYSKMCIRIFSIYKKSCMLSTVEEYATTVMLNGLNFVVPDEWIRTLLFEGLPDNYGVRIFRFCHYGKFHQNKVFIRCEQQE